VNFPQHVIGTLELASSLVHGGDETLGTTKLFRSKGWVFEGDLVRIPVMSGNAIRGMWRRASAIAFMDEYLAAGGSPLSLTAFHFLTSGGSLTGSGGSGINLASERELRTLIPHLGLFGGAGMGRIHAGKLYVDEGVPVCRETVPILRKIWPAIEDEPTAALSIRDLTEVHGYSRQDDSKKHESQRYLVADSREQVTALLTAKETDDTASDAGVSQQMRYEQMELVAGTVLFHRWGFRLPATPLELAGLGAGLVRWAQRPSLGGRNSIGHGNVIPTYQGLEVHSTVKLLTDGDRPLDAFKTQSATESLREHVRANVKEIESALGAV
jgi:CRISPR type IV-associated protein Csf2